MDILIHWDVYRRLRHEIGARGWDLISDMTFDYVVLAVFGTMKLQSDPLIVAIAAVAIAAVFTFERLYLSRWTAESGGHKMG